MRQLTTTTGRQAGVTMLELLAVMVIVAILATIGVPSFRYVTTSNRVATEADALLGDLQYARSEAIREGQAVTVCVSKDDANCDTSAVSPAWQEGWMIFSNPDAGQAVATNDPLLRSAPSFSSTGDTFTSTNGIYAITFSRDGFAELGGTSTRVTLHDSSGSKNYVRCLDVSQTGTMAIQTNSTDPTCK